MRRLVWIALLCAGGCGSEFGASNNNAERCGNGRLDPAEACDGADLGGQSCAGLGFDGGDLACSVICTFDDTGCTGIGPVCGDGVRAGLEECDAADLAEQGCRDLGFQGGILACTDACIFDTSSCSLEIICGDGVADGSEQCDGTDLAGMDCQTLGLGAGTLACSAGCIFDASGCGTPTVCGDGVAEGNEACDGADLRGEDCLSRGFIGGSLGCTGACAFDESACQSPGCGNGVAEGAEQCDGSDLRGEDCVSRGFLSGTLSCDINCIYDTSACVAPICGNGTAEGGEACDGADLRGEDCLSRGFGAGTLACDGSCNYDEAGCFNPTCGDGVAQGNEACDTSDLRGEDCVSRGYVGGFLACDNSCAFDESACVGQVCGDNTIQGTEVCDGSDLQGEDCVSRGFPDGGTLACRCRCLGFDTSGCAQCGDGAIDGLEECDGTALGGATCTGLGFTGGNLGCDIACQFDASGCTGGCAPAGGSALCPATVFSDTTTGPNSTDDINAWAGNGCNGNFHDGREVIYTFTQGATHGAVQATLSGFNQNLNLFVLRDLGGGCAANLPCPDTSTNIFSPSEQVQWLAEETTTYYVVVDGALGAESAFTLSFQCIDLVRQIYEHFPPTDPFDNWDLNGTTVTFTPNGSPPEAYTWSTNTGVAVYPTLPGSGTSSTPLAFAASNDSIQVALPSAFIFFGVSYGDMFVNSNGNITFGAGDTDASESVGELENGAPRIAGHWDAMDPTASGTVTVDEFVDRVVVTWDGVDDPGIGGGTFSIQIELFFTGVIAITNLASGGSDGIVGIGEGGGGLGIGEVNFN